MELFRAFNWIAATIFLLVHMSLLAQERPARIVFSTSNYEPYVVNTKGVASGVIPDIIEEALKGSVFAPDIIFEPWLRGEHALKAGKVFACFPYLKTAERQGEFVFSDPLIYFFPKFFYLKSRFPNGFEWRKLSDFKGYTLGGVRGYWYEKQFKQAGLTIHYVTSDKQNIQMLKLKRVDFTLIDELVGWELVGQSFPKELASYEVASKPESSAAFHLMISPNYPNSKAITRTFNLGLRRIVENGTYQKILERYQVPQGYSVVD